MDRYGCRFVLDEDWEDLQDWAMRCVSFPLLHPVDSRLRGNDGVGCGGCFITG